MTIGLDFDADCLNSMNERDYDDLLHWRFCEIVRTGFGRRLEWSLLAT